MSEQQSMTEAAIRGQKRQDENPHLQSSPMWYAFEAGRALAPMSDIKKCKMSRGYSVRVETAASIFIVSFGNGLESPKVTRK